MKINCPNLKCASLSDTGPKTRPIVLNGTFYRKSDSQYIKRYNCRNCNRYFSNATNNPACWQKKRRINEPLKLLLCSGVSQRRAAQILKINPKTVVRHFRYLSHQAQLEQKIWLDRYKKTPVSSIQFDDLETSEHSKCRPLSVSLAIETKTRKILNFQVSQMPAKGLLVHKAYKKYGPRKDLRARGWDEMMKTLRPYVNKNATWTSDENPHYPKYLIRYHPKAKHFRVKGGRGAVTGQGELKKLKFDPLFSLNHTCAMLRANLNRLFRKTWCTTKNKQGLIDHLAIYITYHNKVLTEQSAI